MPSNYHDKERLLNHQDTDAELEHASESSTRAGKWVRRERPSTSWRTLAILVLTIVASNLCTGIYVVNRLKGPSETQSSHVAFPKTHDDQTQKKDPPTIPIVEELPTAYTRFKWWTAWGMEAGATNDTNLPSAHVADELWEGVLPSHGLIAVDRVWAKEQHWPESMYLPKDPNGKEKGVYLLEAYHMMHCLSIIRLSFVETRRGLPLTWPVGHTTHCFDALRQVLSRAFPLHDFDTDGLLLQSIQCNADNTPLYTFGDSTAGDGQLRKCKSWDALREFATENSACYIDSTKEIPLRDHFGYCEDGMPYQGGKDGLPTDSG
ncbi:hypothetical protein DOTSEDRAFT_30036 [Dothistroma septosporum NZE10]|uniref:Uncharacterized protein n=1 Tax=Dothistroma septosporum (strain NZE10 / CBS 128990) TaxID=675120 RepID=N1Q050_DOTSN|nr:hypothetical protein DOTSEDRAFT_30036 [Dothistroma septosporum NZE10]